MDTIGFAEAIKYYKGKKIFLTGHTGFKGSWLTLLLKQFGAEIRGFSQEPHTEPNHFSMLGIKNEINNIDGDIRNYGELKSAIQEFEPEIIFHLAAQAIVKNSYSDPLYTYNTNTIGTANLLDATKDINSVKSVVCITSDKCYENFEWTWGYRENDILGGFDPYSASKAAAELIFSSYQRAFFSKKPFLGAATARAGNVIGGGDWSEHRLIPDLIKSISSNLPVKIRNPQSTRPWQHVLEPLSGYILLAVNLIMNKDLFSGSWNFGPSSMDVMSVNQVIEIIISKLKKGEIEIVSSENNEHEANLLQLNCDKAIQSLNWKPRWSANKSIEETAEWYNVYLSGGNVRDKSESQIKEYFGNDI